MVDDGAGKDEVRGASLELRELINNEEPMREPFGYPTNKMIDDISAIYMLLGLAFL